MNAPNTLQCIAHRGGRKLGTENTLATITKALQLGVDAVEVDVWRVGGQLLITHDRELGRVIVGNGRLLDVDPNEISTLRHYDGSEVATLEQVIDLVANKARLNIELKGPGCAAAVAELVREKVVTHNLDDKQLVVSSFDHQQLAWLHEHAPEIKRGVLVYGHLRDGIACCEKLRAYSYHPSVDFIDPQLIAAARNKNMEVWVYTVNREEDFRDLLAMGVTGVFTDDPELLMEFNNAVGQR
jgi:glycerophosphoryl diester phosphodiesterase